MNTTRLSRLSTPDSFILGDAFRGFLQSFRREAVPEAPMIKIDVAEAGETYSVKAESPRGRKEAVHVEIDRPPDMVIAPLKKDSGEKMQGRACSGCGCGRSPYLVAISL